MGRRPGSLDLARPVRGRTLISRCLSQAHKLIEQLLELWGDRLRRGFSAYGPDRGAMPGVERVKIVCLMVCDTDAERRSKRVWEKSRKGLPVLKGQQREEPRLKEVEQRRGRRGIKHARVMLIGNMGILIFPFPTEASCTGELEALEHPQSHPAPTLRKSQRDGMVQSVVSESLMQPWKGFHRRFLHLLVIGRSFPTHCVT